MPDSLPPPATSSLACASDGQFGLGWRGAAPGFAWRVDRWASFRIGVESSSADEAVVAVASSRRIKFPRALAALRRRGSPLRRGASGGCRIGCRSGGRLGRRRSSPDLAAGCWSATVVVATLLARWPDLRCSLLLWLCVLCAASLVGCTGVGRSCCVGSVREVARLELGSWMEVAGSGVPRRRCRSVTTGQRSKKCGDSRRPTTHIGKCAVACGGVCFEVRNAAGLPWHFLGAGLVGGSPSSPPADATATTAAGIDGCEDGGCRDPEGPFCYFSFSGVVPVSFPGELSFRFVPERGRVRYTVLVV